MRATIGRYLSIACVLSLAPVASADISGVITEKATPCVHLRAAPKPTAKSTDCLTPGTSVTITASSPYWRKVSHAGGTGWIAKKFLRTTSGAAPTSDQWLEVHIVDVGQGDGIWIHTPDDGLDNGRFEGKNIIIDGGPDAKDSANALLAYLRQFAHHDAIIDALLISHPHDDHYPGAASILRNFEVKTVYDSGFPKEGPKYATFLTLVRSESNVDLRLGRDSFGTLRWGNELDAEIIYAYPGTPENLGRDSTLENNASIVLRLQYGKHVFLFMGDAEGKERKGSAADSKYVERVLLDSVPHSRLKASVLKIAHHGSETSSTTPFIAAVDPEYVMVSSGRRAYSGTFLPQASTLQRYCCHNQSVRIYRTDQDDELEGRTAKDDADGDHIVIRTDGESIIVQAYSNGVPITLDACQPGCEDEP